MLLAEQRQNLLLGLLGTNMIYLFTGVPGAGKTLNAIKFVCEFVTQQVKDDSGNVEHREVFYYNINKLDLPWNEIDLIQAMDWMSLPDKSIIILDECHEDIFPQRDAKTPVPEHVKKLATHRHHGLDFVFIGQHPMQMDAALRRLVGRHFHFDRKFGARVVNRHTWNFCIDNPNDQKEQKRSVTDRIKFDKKYFAKYKSTEMDTHKFKLPPKLTFAICAVVVMVALIVNSFIGLAADDAIAATADNPIIQNPVFMPNLAPARDYDAEVNSALLASENPSLPRVSGLPWTAPRYDHLQEVNSAPRPAGCLVFEGGYGAGVCKCFTQQATPLAVPRAICLDIVRNGYFDERLVDSAYDEAYSDDTLEM